MVWGHPDGRAAAARPAWHSRREEPVRTRYQRARMEAMERAEERPPIVITDEAVAGVADVSAERERRWDAAAGRSVVPPRAAPAEVAAQVAAPDAAPTEVAADRASAAEVAVSAPEVTAPAGDLDAPVRPAAASPAVLAAFARTTRSPRSTRSRRGRPDRRPRPAAPAEPVPGRISEVPTGSAGEPEAEDPIVIDDVGVGPARSDGPAAVPRHDIPAARPGSLDDRRAGRRGPRVVAAAAAVVVVATGAGVAFHELGHSRPAGQVASGARASGSSRPAVTVPPASTVPPALTATSTSATEAVYTVTAGSLQVSVDASAPCWVELRSGSPSGPVVYEGTLQSGASQTFSAGNGLWMRLGNPGGVQMRINGAAVNLPAAANPFNITVTTA